VQAASAGQAAAVRLPAVTALKGAMLRRVDVLALLEAGRNGQDPAWRATAAQVLGFHRSAVTFREIVPELQAMAVREKDPAARRAMVFALRDCEGAAALLSCGDEATAAEAVCALPPTRASWEAMLKVYYSGSGVTVELSEDALIRASSLLETAILARVGQAPDAPAWTVAFLLAASFPEEAGDPSERTARLFAELDDAALLNALLAAPSAVDRTHAGIWPGLARRERRLALIEILVEGMAERGMSTALAVGLVRRIAEDEAFWEGQTRIGRMLLRAARADSARAMLAAAGVAFPKADRMGRRRLVDAMLELGRAVPDAAQEVERLLSTWDEQAPGAGLRARQMRLVRR
jgi:hypothetical protein